MMLDEELEGLIELQGAAAGLSPEQVDRIIEHASGVLTAAACLENVRLGHMVIVGIKDGEPTYRMTDEGRRHVESMLRGDEN